MAAVRDSFKYSGAGRASDPAWRVVIAPGPSRRAGAWIAAVAAAALAAAWAAAIPGPCKAALAGVVGVAALHAFRRHARQEGPGVIRRLAVDLDGRVEAEGADGRLVPGRLAEGSFVAPWLTVVRWVPEGARLSRAVVLFPDAVETAEFRRLRILLCWR